MADNHPSNSQAARPSDASLRVADRRATVVRAQSQAAADPDVLLQLATVMAMTGLGRTSIYGRIKAGTFPAPLRLSGRCSRWRAGAVREWLRAAGQPT